MLRESSTVVSLAYVIEEELPKVSPASTAPLVVSFISHAHLCFFAANEQIFGVKISHANFEGSSCARVHVKFREFAD